MIILRKPFFVLADSKGRAFIYTVQIICKVFYKKHENK
jgi:hypothetical protein